MSITIKELSERAAVKIPTIRYYERQGLLPEPVRTGTGQRRYGSVDVARLRFVRFGRGLGMEIDGIRALIEMVGEGNGEEIIVAAEAIAERAKRIMVFCEGLRSVSAAIIAGSIDEAGTFDRLMAGEEAELEELAGAPPTLVPDAAETPECQEAPHTETTVAEDEASTAVEPISAEPTAEVTTEGAEPETLLSKPKRKRAHAKS
ncbi:MerR family transcriptional regulator [Methylobacterium sp. E-066]|uniref:MerR family transcriptional regulator n=1 Tax=Methylobacterium sp. E-066 TaxID=2836584 RepID=UPI001FB9BAAC|nr:MerR family transcriptional regulator [Methylobacterium sp. E-066]MCJ2144346.1 MerR family transcriptional regulator [Methylobacterium sp. E-066]